MAVVGGGVIGLAIAWRAAQRGLRAVVLERDQPGRGASWVAAGMLAPVTEARLNERELLALGIESARRYPEFVAPLGAGLAYERCGTIVVARDRDDAEALERELELRRDLGLEVTRLRPSQARALEPALAPTIRLALEIPDDHAVDPRLLTGALAERVPVRSAACVAAIEPGIGVTLANGERVAAEQVVIASGAWASGLEGVPEGVSVPVHPVKGQLLRLHDPSGPGLIRRVLRTGEGYLVPRADGRYVLGATMEEMGFDTSVTAGAVFELLRDVTELVPGISELIIDELIAGLRPATPDGLPAIGPGALPGLHWAVGHYRNGVLLAPITAEIVVAGLLGESLPAVAAPFTPNRFERVTMSA